MNTTSDKRKPPPANKTGGRPAAVFTESSLYATVLNNTTDMIFLVSEGGTVDFYNRAVCEHHDIPAGIPCLQLKYFWCSGSIDRVDQALALIVRERCNLNIECTCGDNHYEVKFSCYTHGDDRLSIVCIARDITERKQTEAALKSSQEDLERKVRERTESLEKSNRDLLEAKERLETLIETSLDPIIISDATGHIVEANQSFLKMIDQKKKDVLGKVVHEFSPYKTGKFQSTTGEWVMIDDGFFEEAGEMIARLFEEGRSNQHTTYYLRKNDNKIVPAIENIALLYNKEGERVGSFAIIHDITGLKKAELEQVRAREAAEEASRAKSNFLANMSHEIRTPMNAVIGFADILMDTRLDGEQQDYAFTIKSSADSLLSLINDILDLSKIEAEQILFEEIEFDIEVLAHDACELVRPRLDNSRVELRCRITEAVPAVVRGDPYRLRQVLVNLLGNAVKFTRAGEIGLSLGVESEDTEFVFVNFKVSDTGVGIAKDKAEIIFDAFQQADSSTTRRFGGTGLGLAICRRLIEHMGGKIRVESEPGRGSTFHFTAAFRKADKKVSKRVEPVALSGLRVIMADTSRTGREIMSHALKSAGMRITAAESADELYNGLRESIAGGSPFDICMIDICTLDRDGCELAKNIRAKLGYGGPMLALCTLAEKGAAVRCRQAGFNGFLPKSVSRPRLIQVLKRMLSETAGNSREPGGDGRDRFVTQHSILEECKHGASILLAEDNPVNQKLAVALLEKVGYRVAVTANGKEAVEIYTADPSNYDIILMDIQMPVLSGLDAARAIRDWESKNSCQADSKQNAGGRPCHAVGIPIVAMTANAMKGDREVCLTAGMNDYIPKPIKREVVFEMLKKWVIETECQGSRGPGFQGSSEKTQKGD